MAGETNSIDLFYEKFHVEELLVYRNVAWSWSIRPSQATLGSSVISLNRYARRFSEVTANEMEQLAEIHSKLEHAVKNAFNHDIMNYLALMMIDHHVHYHAIPRYDGEREFAGQIWVDNGWPALPLIQDSQHSDDPDLLYNIREILAREANQ
jgi:diadenosine tetraphosphate (Ap4A) HIT family hydrolase